MPGIGATACFRRPTMSSTLARRSSRGRSVMARRPAFGVGFIRLTPRIETRPVTSGSFLIAASTCACSRCIWANDTSVPASDTAEIRPVSCDGRKPFGMTI